MLSLSVPALNSHPGAAQTLYLDFDGSAAFAWDNGTGYVVRGPNSSIFAPTPVQAFSTDGDFNNFSAAEIATIDHIYQWVAEKYSPFTINVTTVDPGFVSDGLTMTCLIAGSAGDWYGGVAGGISDIGGFIDGGENTCFVFSADVVNNGLSGGRLEQYIGESVAHEAGHEVGLLHQRSPGDEYYDGNILRAPIMGGSGNNTVGRGIWWLTNNFAGQNSGDPVQDDLGTLTQIGPDWLKYAGDFDGGNLPFNSAGAVIPVKGLINSTSDIDGFAFTATGSTATFAVTNWQYGGMLAPVIKIRVSGTQTYVSGFTSTGNISSAISTTSLTVGGNYVLEVSSQGNYGDIGQYTITGSQTVFAAYDAASRTVSVGGFVGNNNITIFTNGVNTLTVQDSLDGGPTSTLNFTLSAVDSISVNLGSGNDTLNWNGLFKGDNVTDIPVYVSMGGGTDTLKLGGDSTFLTFDVGSIIIGCTYAGVRTSNIWNFDADVVQLYGTSSTDTFNINSQNQFSSIAIFAGGGDDRCVIGPELFDENRPVVTFHGEGGTDTLELADQTIAQDQDWFVWNNNVTHHVDSTSSQGETDFDATVENIVISGGAGNDSFQAYEVAVGHTVTFNGNGGNDGFSAGYNDGHEINIGLSFSGAIQGTVSVIGGQGDDHLYVDDSDYYGGFNGYTIASSYISNSSNPSYQNFVLFGGDVEQLNFYAGNGGSRIVTLQGLPAAAALNVFGGSGLGDKLIVNDRALQVVPFRIDVRADYYKEYYGTQQAPAIRQLSQTLGFENFEVTAHNNTNTVNVFALAATQYTTINCGINADTVTLYPHDVNGNLTINGSLSVLGGAGSDNLIIDDAGSTSPIHYVFTNFLTIIDQIDGLGAGTLGPGGDIENITIKGGDGDDTFSFDGHKLNDAVAIYGGGGNDVLDFGGGNLPANIANLPTFLFDGEDGFDRFNLNNGTETSDWTYTVNGALLGASRDAPVLYVVLLSGAHNEETTVNAGPGADTFFARSVVAGTHAILNGAGGMDIFQPGLFVGGLTNLGVIQGKLTFDAGDASVYGPTGGGTVSISASAQSAPITAHLDATTIGAFPGDSLFGPGGSVEFKNATQVNLTLGTGADTMYAQPNATAAVGISGSNPMTAPGDTLHLALAGAVNYVVTPTSATAGNVTSTNLNTLTYSRFETGPNVNAVAPTANVVDVTPDPRTTSVNTIAIDFTEAVTGFSLADLSLTLSGGANLLPASATLTSGNQINWTLGNLGGLALTSGAYLLTLNVPGSGIADLFGNAMLIGASDAWTANIPPLMGDANGDNVVDIFDVNLVSAHWGQTGPLGDVNHDNMVDIFDVNLISANWGQVLGGGGGNGSGSAANDSSSEADSATGNSPLRIAANVVEPAALPAEVARDAIATPAAAATVVADFGSVSDAAGQRLLDSHGLDYAWNTPVSIAQFPLTDHAGRRSAVLHRDAFDVRDGVMHSLSRAAPRTFAISNKAIDAALGSGWNETPWAQGGDDETVALLAGQRRRL